MVPIKLLDTMNIQISFFEASWKKFSSLTVAIHSFLERVKVERNIQSNSGQSCWGRLYLCDPPEILYCTVGYGLAHLMGSSCLS